MKTILIPIENHVSIDTVMRGASLLGRRFESYMEGAALGPDFTELAAADFSFSGMVFDEKTRRELFDEALRAFESFMLAQGVKRQGEAAAGPSFGWMGPRLMTDQGIGEYGRVFDLIVVGKPENGVNTPRRLSFETALFESGRPVLIVPPKLPAAIGECIAIAWNGSSETARTVAFAMPLLCQARDVPVVYVPHSRLSGPNAEELTRSLRRHGIAARTVLMGEDALKAPGAALLEKADQLGADLLIKGGYAQSRLRDMFFGSVTSEVIAKTQLPVFMAH